MKKNVILGLCLTSMLSTNVLAADVIYSSGNVNVRSAPDMEASLVGAMGYNAECVVLEGSDEYGWIKIQSGDVIGYVAGQYFSDVPLEGGYTLAQINAEALNIRTTKDQESGTIGSLNYLDVIEVTDYDGSGWVNVVTNDGLYGYVSADYVNLVTYYPTAVSVDEIYYEEPSYYEDYSYDYDYEDYSYEEPSCAYNYDDYSYTESYEEPSYSETYEEPNYNETYEEPSYTEEESAPVETPSYSGNAGVSGTANQYVGSSYVWGGSSPGGFDCSGLAQYSYAQNGVSIPRTAADQYNAGTKISVDEAIYTPGALIFYHGFGHVAVSNGDGTVTHASNSTTGVIVSNAYYSTPCGAAIY